MGGNTLNIGNKTRLKRCHFRFKGRGNRIIIGGYCNLSGLSIMCEGDNNNVYIGKGVVVNATKQKAVIMNAIEGTSIYIGDGCLLSNNIELHSSDYHSILDIKSTKRINSAKNIHIGDRVWIGFRSIILKGTNLPDDTIVGAGSIVTGHFSDSNSVIAGNPAKVVKSGIKWIHKKI